MKKCLLIFFLLIFVPKIFLAQHFYMYNKDTINVIDSRNKKQGKWIYFDKNKNIFEDGLYKDNKKVGTWKKFYPTGKIKSEITYKDNVQIGNVIIYYENGNIKEQGYWEKNKWIGNYRYYHQNGELKYSWFFDINGKRTGEQLYYHENGKVLISGNWQSGKETEIITEYYANGKIKKTANFSSGVLNGLTTEYYQDGNIKSKIIFIKGKADNIQRFSEPTKNVTKTNITELENSQTNQTSTNNGTASKTFKGTGYFKFLNIYEKVDREGTFASGVLIEGKRYFYDDNGNVTKIAIIKNGKTTNVIEGKQ